MAAVPACMSGSGPACSWPAACGAYRNGAPRPGAEAVLGLATENLADLPPAQ